MLIALILVFIGIAVALAWFLIAHDRGEKEPIWALWMATGFGLLGAGLASVIENKLIPVNHLQPGTAHGTLLVASLAVGVIEETCKFLPLAVVLYGRRYFNEHTDGVIYFALAGLGFGLPENILYAVQYGASTAFVRVFLTAIFHAATTGFVGYFLAKRKLANRRPWGVIVPLAAMMLLHGLYDFGLTSGSAVYGAGALVISLGISASLFLLFLKATERDQDMGLSAVGHNNFCRSCGQPNLQHHLYCARCGQRA